MAPPKKAPGTHARERDVERYQIQLDSATRAEWQAEADADQRPLAAWIRIMVERGRLVKPAGTRG